MDVLNEKKQRIIEVSMRLFAEKGFHTTSIQEIAKTSNVSKGAFYLYFDSKDDLLLAIFEYYTKMIFQQVEDIRKQDLDPREKLAQQVNVFLEMISDHKEFVIMHFRDNLQVGAQFDEMMLKMNKQGFDWTRSNFKEIYGDKIDRYLVDAAIQFDGLLAGYFKWIVLHDLKVDTKALAASIVRRLDDLVLGMIDTEESPQVTIDHLTFKNLTSGDSVNEKEHVKQLLDQLTEVVHNQSGSSEKEELLEAIDVIASELDKKQPKKIIIQGMLNHFQTQPACKDICKEIATVISIPNIEKD